MKHHRKPILALVLAALMLVSFAAPALAAPHGVTVITAVAGTEAQSFSFLASGDPQLGAGNLESDRAGWLGSLASATQAWTDLAFLVTAGDQVNTNKNEAQLEAFFAPVAEIGLPLAPTPGNHDPDILEGLGVPNMDRGGNYWYTYGDALFLHLNSNYTVGSFTRAFCFLWGAARANRDASWRIAAYHHTFYSTSSRAVTPGLDILIQRMVYAALFGLFSVDLALTGHDHVYTRTKPMRFLRPAESGTIYLTMNSGSGSKYYDETDKEFNYVAASMQVRVPTLTKIDVTRELLTLTTVRTDTMAVLDEFIIRGLGTVVALGNASLDNSYL